MFNILVNLFKGLGSSIFPPLLPTIQLQINYVLNTQVVKKVPQENDKIKTHLHEEPDPRANFLLLCKLSHLLEVHRQVIDSCLWSLGKPA